MRQPSARLGSVSGESENLGFPKSPTEVTLIVLRVDSLSILSNYRSFRPDPFPWVSGGRQERRIPGKMGNIAL